MQMVQISPIKGTDYYTGVLKKQDLINVAVCLSVCVVCVCVCVCWLRELGENWIGLRVLQLQST